MVRLPIYQVDAFTAAVFGGNPAAVIPLQTWLDDALLQAIARENNLSETAFLVADGDGFALRWFTPSVEVELCGHATLAAAHVLFAHLGHGGDDVLFYTRSGELRVSRVADGLQLDFPARPLQPVAVDVSVCDALGAVASECLASIEANGYLMCVYEFEQDVAALSPDFRALRDATGRCVIVTAPGEQSDFVSRFFAPGVAIDEDPVTGSAHCSLVPYWAARLGRARLSARQISVRGGELSCELAGRRVLLVGRAVTFMQGHLVEL